MYNVVVFWRTESRGYESAGARRNLAYLVLTMPSLRSSSCFFILLRLAFLIELFMAWITLYFGRSSRDVEQLRICLCCEVDDHVMCSKAHPGSRQGSTYLCPRRHPAVTDSQECTMHSEILICQSNSLYEHKKSFHRHIYCSLPSSSIGYHKNPRFFYFF